MADIAASVLTRLKNKAQASGRSYQLCLQLFCQEEFLRRLEKSKYAENFVLKGGLFIYSLTEFDSRVTVDVDFLLRQMPNTPEQLRVVLEEIIATPTENEFVTFEITDVAPIAVAKKYAGIGASLVAHIKNTRTPLKSIYDNQFCIGVFIHKSCKLFIKSISKLTRRNREVQIIRTFCSEHPVQSFLQSVVIIFESKVQHRSFSYIIIPKRYACTDVICKLCHKKTFAKFRCSCKDICSWVKQAVNQWRFALIHRVIQLTHRNRFQM